MSISGLHGRAVFDPLNLSDGDAFACCDRCGITYSLKDLVWQYDWRGNSLQNIRILVCKLTCNDEPFEFFRPVVLPPDPMPILDARPPFYAVQEGPPPNPNNDSVLAQLVD